MEASKQEKLMRAYDMRKKLEMRGAMAFRSAVEKGGYIQI